jgi:hypothetical protein
MMLAPNDAATFICHVNNPPLTNINWTWTGYTPTNPIVGNGGLGLTFTLPVASTAYTTRTTNWTITAQHPCGLISRVIPFSVVTRGWTAQKDPIDEVNENSQLKNVAISPNPATDFIQFNYSAQKATKAVIFNINGAIVKTFLAKNGVNKIDIADLSAGVYMLEIFDNSSVIKRKVVKL